MTLHNGFKKGKGNRKINRQLARKATNGWIIQRLPTMEVNGQQIPIGTPISPTECVHCGHHELKHKEYYTRWLISSYGILQVETSYWKCLNPQCKKPNRDLIVGVTGSANYTDEYNAKSNNTRYDGKASLHNTRAIGQIFTNGMTDDPGRAQCPTTLWKYDQFRGEIAYQALQTELVPFDGTIHVDGYWIKLGGRKALEESLGVAISKKVWRKLRYQSIYVITTKDKVVVDFEITPAHPTAQDLEPLLQRVKERFGPSIKRIVADDEHAIWRAAMNVFQDLDIEFSLCTFHQLEKIKKLFHDEFPRWTTLTEFDKKCCGLALQVVLSNNVIASTIYLRKLQEKAANTRYPVAFDKLLQLVKKYYHKNRDCFARFFRPTTNNVMEQLFSLINDFVFQARSFKTKSGAHNFFANLFHLFNHRAFNTGSWRGQTPLERATIRLS